MWRTQKRKMREGEKAEMARRRRENGYESQPKNSIAHATAQRA